MAMFDDFLHVSHKFPIFFDRLGTGLGDDDSLLGNVRQSYFVLEFGGSLDNFYLDWG